MLSDSGAARDASNIIVEKKRAAAAVEEEGGCGAGICSN